MLCLPVYKDVYKLWITWAKLSVSRCDALCITRIKNNKNIAQNSQKVGGCAFINNLAFIYKNQGKLRYKNYCLITLITLIILITTVSLFLVGWIQAALTQNTAKHGE